MPQTLAQLIWWGFLLAISIIGWLINRNMIITLEKINANQDNLAKFIGGEIDDLKCRQETLEDDQKETRKELDNLLGQHKIMVGLGGH